jgi:hypothetical protein
MGGHNDPDQNVVPLRVSLLNGLRTVVYGIVAGLSLAGLRPAEKLTRPGWSRAFAIFPVLWLGPVLGAILFKVTRNQIAVVTLLFATSLAWYAGYTSAGYDSQQWNGTHMEGAAIGVFVQAILPLAFAWRRAPSVLVEREPLGRTNDL